MRSGTAHRSRTGHCQPVWSACAGSCGVPKTAPPDGEAFYRRCLPTGLAAVEAACIEVLAESVHSTDVVLKILSGQRDAEESKIKGHKPGGVADIRRRRPGGGKPARQPEVVASGTKVRDFRRIPGIALDGPGPAYDRAAAEGRASFRRRRGLGRGLCRFAGGHCHAGGDGTRGRAGSYQYRRESRS